jgi:3-hydroxyacyl-CoA dehydrogenase/3-hydroxy-2-methylbutyryl-CoA dehydrogenase
MELSGQVAVVTGGAFGLGRATVRTLAAAGASVAVLDRYGAAAKQVAAECRGALPVEVDVANEGSVQHAMRAVADAFGSVHVCVNAAGVGTGGKVVARGKALPLAEFRAVVEVNLIGLFDVVRRCAELMVGNPPGRDGERGVIVNVSSPAAWHGQRGQAAYAASKAGVIGLMLPVARDLAEYGVRVVTVAPGLFETGMYHELPGKIVERLRDTVLYPDRPGDPAEFAELVEHIVRNRYFNATTVALDAGVRLV